MQPGSTRYVVENAPDTIAWLQTIRRAFFQEEGRLHLTREGGHSARRIVHATDATGAAVQQTLIAHVRQMPNITLLEQHTLVDLITSRKLGLPGPQRCLGLYALDGATDEVITFRAPHTVLATGGGQGLPLHHQPRRRLRRRHRHRLAGRLPGGNLEFIQFHPTCLYHPQSKNLPNQRSRARRGRTARSCPDGDALHAPASTRAKSWPRATSWPAPLTLR